MSSEIYYKCTDVRTSAAFLLLMLQLRGRSGGTGCGTMHSVHFEVKEVFGGNHSAHILLKMDAENGEELRRARRAVMQKRVGRFCPFTTQRPKDLGKPNPKLRKAFAQMHYVV